MRRGRCWGGAVVFTLRSTRRDVARERSAVRRGVREVLICLHLDTAVSRQVTIAVDRERPLAPLHVREHHRDMSRDEGLLVQPVHGRVAWLRDVTGADRMPRAVANAPLIKA